MVGEANWSWACTRPVAWRDEHHLRARHPEQQEAYLTKLVSGEWTGTMCLTEPHCGTDLGMLRTKAEPQADGSYKSPAPRSSSRPASTTWPTTSSTWCWPACRTHRPAPRASRCSSCPSSSQRRRHLGERNAVSCGSLEHKMGIHGNATCVMNFDAPPVS
jgi:alkylation response protein AidB-like acyl-CoA dehydrogenase